MPVFQSVVYFIYRHEESTVSLAFCLNTNREIIIVAETKIQIRTAAGCIHSMREIGCTTGSMRAPLENGDMRQLQQYIVNR